MTDFDLTRLDSGVVNLQAPELLAHKLLQEALEFDTPGETSIAEVDEDRIRLVINAIVAANLINDAEKPAWAKEISEWRYSDWTNFGGQVQITDTNVKFMKLRRCLVLLLPNINDESQTDLIISTLNDLAEHEAINSDWIIDIFNMAPIPEKLLTFLIGFQHGLSSSVQRLLSLLWLRKDAVPDYLAPAVSKHFHTVKKGMFLLSKI